MNDQEALKLTKPWRVLSPGEELVALQRRYDIEITPSHLLSGLDGRVVARTDASDDILVETSDRRFAKVHLTWTTGGFEWPSFTIYETWEQALSALKEDL